MDAGRGQSEEESSREGKGHWMASKVQLPGPKESQRQGGCVRRKCRLSASMDGQVRLARWHHACVMQMQCH